MASDQSECAQKLKDEGNGFFSQKDYQSASTKYTEAIALDKSNPVLYANRSACRLHLKQYLDAATDAHAAIELNPSYGKAWARLATARDALRQPWNSIGPWQKALESLSKDNLSEAELKQKNEYEAGLAAAAKANELYKSGADNVKHLAFEKDDRSFTPWMCATALLPRFQRERNFESSAWAVSRAYSDLMQGNEWLTEQKTKANSQGEMLKSRLGVIEHLSNAIMMDTRAFHISDQEWVAKFNKQLQLENGHYRSWVQFGPEKILKEAESRLAAEGWDSVRPALSVTIRSWILFGFLEGGSRGNFVSEAEHIGRALEVINWGRKTWPDVPSEDRGVIFMDTFLRGVQKLHIEALVKVCSSEKGSSSKLQLLEELKKVAEEMIKAIDDIEPPIREHDPASAAAFYYYPRGHARAAKAFYYGRKAELSEDKEEARELHGEATACYIEATADFPEDDEEHTVYTNAACQHMLEAGAPVGLQLKYMQKLRESIAKAQPIWGKRMSIETRGKQFEHILKYEKEYRKLLAEGKITEDDKVGEVFNATVSLLEPEDESFGNPAKRASASRIRGGSGETGAVIGQILAEFLKALPPQELPQRSSKSTKEFVVLWSGLGETTQGLDPSSRAIHSENDRADVEPQS
ncbi:hypothetical protein V5O48_006415 [Marasmius crinis-equi]|uniref:Uncharacterized protein n=1 Tax=Marasmius crinis-equi TaxID=585013 RepID=A0ABR3FJU4_9AGAR